MSHIQVFILEKETTVGEWLLQHLTQIGVEALWIPSVANLLSHADDAAPVICLVGLRPPVAQALSLIADLTQEPRFAQTAFILMGPLQYKHAAFEAGADDYLITPPDVIELRKRVRLYLDRANLEARVVAETRISQEIDALSSDLSAGERAGPTTEESVSLLEHAAVLTSERDMFEQTLHYTPYPLALVTPNGNARYVNPAWKQTFGDSPPGAPLNTGWPPITTDPDITRALAAAIQVPDVWQGDVCLASAIPQRDFAMSVTPIFDAANDLSGFVIVCADIRDRKTREAMQTHFIVNATNELRTPVTNIKLRQYLLQEASEDQRPMHLLALEQETDHLQRLLDALLELSRMDASLVTLERKPVNLNRVLDEAVTRYTPTAETRDIRLTHTHHDTLPPTLIDARYLAQALGAVIENALLHTSSGGRVDIRLGSEAWSGGNFATIQVRDTGMGITADTLPHIFERFYRGDRARDRGIRGIGLGLAIAQEIIARHQGTIIAESVVDQGSMFTIWLPLENA